MWHRQPKDQTDPWEVDPDADTVERAAKAWEQWEERWARPEEERVARWLRAKGASFDPGADRDGREPVTAVLTETATTGGSIGQGELGPAPGSLELEAATAELAARREESRLVAAELAAERFELTALREQVRAQAAALEAIRAEVAALEEQRQRVVESIESAELAAERARLSEREAVSALVAAQDQASQGERERFELWEALDAQVAALEKRRLELGHTGPGDA